MDCLGLHSFALSCQSSVGLCSFQEEIKYINLMQDRLCCCCCFPLLLIWFVWMYHSLTQIYQICERTWNGKEKTILNPKLFKGWWKLSILIYACIRKEFQVNRQANNHHGMGNIVEGYRHCSLFWVLIPEWPMRTKLSFQTPLLTNLGSKQ